ncbi:MAG: hypothetical protein WCH01_19760 [Methylococcaceae bacterium]
MAKPNLLSSITKKSVRDPEDFIALAGGETPKEVAPPVVEVAIAKEPTTEPVKIIAREKITLNLPTAILKALTDTAHERGGRKKGWTQLSIVELALLDWFEKENISVVD